MRKYDADRRPEPAAWLALDEYARIELVAAYHRRHHPRTPRIRLHSTFHAVVENQLAEGVPAVVETLDRLRAEGLSRHDAIHAIGSVLATQVFHALRDSQATQGEQQPADAPDLNDVYAAALRNLTAATWRAG
jgi:hypothetical protein